MRLTKVYTQISTNLGQPLILVVVVVVTGGKSPPSFGLGREFDNKENDLLY
jgi:hypothetical protein